jgi:hypothetical protein
VNACATIGSAAQDCSCSPLSFIERWNGTHWSHQPATATYLGEYRGVACSGPRSCTVVGSPYAQSLSTPTPPLAKRWNGARWSAHPARSLAGAFSAGLEDISCVAARCMAVGSWVSVAPVLLHTLAEQYR